MQLIPLTLILLMLLVPLPSIVLKILWGAEVLFAIVILLNSFTGRNKDKFSVMLLCFCLFSLALNIALLRFGLSSTMLQHEGIFLIRWIEEKTIDDTYSLALIISMSLIIADVLLVSTPSFHISEIIARFAHDSMNTKFFEIDNRLNKKEISENEAAILKNAIQNEADTKSKLAGATKFLSGSIKVSSSLLILYLLIGLLIGIFVNNLNFLGSLKTTTPSFFVSSILFTVPQIIIGIAVKLKIKREQLLQETL